MKKRLIKILLVLTLPIWGIPFILREFSIVLWEDISNWVDNNL